PAGPSYSPPIRRSTPWRRPGCRATSTAGTTSITRGAPPPRSSCCWRLTCSTAPAGGPFHDQRVNHKGTKDTKKAVRQALNPLFVPVFICALRAFVVIPDFLHAPYHPVRADRATDRRPGVRHRNPVRPAGGALAAGGAPAPGTGQPVRGVAPAEVRRRDRP